MEIGSLYVYFHPRRRPRFSDMFLIEIVHRMTFFSLPFKSNFVPSIIYLSFTILFLFFPLPTGFQSFPFSFFLSLSFSLVLLSPSS